jgi:hypothetical protein
MTHYVDSAAHVFIPDQLRCIFVSQVIIGWCGLHRRLWPDSRYCERTSQVLGADLCVCSPVTVLPKLFHVLPYLELRDRVGSIDNGSITARAHSISNVTSIFDANCIVDVESIGRDRNPGITQRLELSVLQPVVGVGRRIHDT